MVIQQYVCVLQIVFRAQILSNLPLSAQAEEEKS